MSLLTDYGLEDGSVGALHSVLHRRTPGTPIVDLTHGIPPQDVRAGSLALRRAAPYIAPGVVVAIVDPGVGTSRRAVAVATPEVVFLGPDNGLLMPAVEAVGGAELALVLEDRGYWLPAPGPTFAGRDVFAPAAAHLASGGDLLELGALVELSSLERLPAPVARRTEGGGLETEVTWVDRYGNVQLAAGPEGLALARVTSGELTLAIVTGAARVQTVGRARTDQQGPWRARVVSAFAELAPGELGALVDSYGQLALCLNSASAAAHLGTAEGDLLVLSRA